MNNDYNDTPSRVKKNASLYKRIDKEDLDTLEPTSNTTILDNNKNTIDVEKLKSMLDRKYREPKKKLEEREPIVTKEISLEETREYDLNDMIKNAKDKEDTDYEKERLKSISDTGLSILDELDIEHKSVVSSEPEKLVELIDTINLKEQDGYKELEEETNDMFSELKSSDEETKVVGAKEIDEIVSEDNDKKEKEESIDDIKDEEDDDEERDYVDSDDTVSLTTTQVFTKDDFSEFEDLKEATKPKFFVKFLIFLVIVLVICGTVFFLNRFFDLGLF